MKVFSAQTLDMQRKGTRFINDPQRNQYTAKLWKLSKSLIGIERLSDNYQN